ncbi:hypothetical protein P7K49_034640 [Saguinus oedipus]|uniref:Uncharacterized protein n=1 Tax=Saguinus oedipus TaxID=9490 RepID=A0ABQ9TWE7_SAGOE|nr:hypothetical protein P7K49_034640 [Saguinus oedipus]
MRVMKPRSLFVGSSGNGAMPLSSALSPRLPQGRELEVQLGRSREEALAGRAARQEAEALRGLVRGLELELRQERGLGHRVAGRRGQDCRRLAKEVSGGDPGAAGEAWTLTSLEEAKASERSLRARLKTLTSELALYKRGKRTPPVQLPLAREDRALSSRERSTSRGRGATRSSSQESGRGSRGRGRPTRPSPSPTGLSPALRWGGDALALPRPVLGPTRLLSTLS